MASVVEYGGKADNYAWTQTKEDVTVTVPIPKGTKARDINCLIKPNSLFLQLKGSPAPLIDGQLHDRVITQDSTWTIDGETLEIVLAKQPTEDEKKQWWKSVIPGHPEIDTELIEASKFLDESLLKKIKANKTQKKEEEGEGIKEETEKKE